MKICKKCNSEKDESEFYKDSAKKDKLTARCKVCCKAAEHDYHKRNPVKKANRKRKDMISKTGLPITMIEYNTMLEEQNDKCGICDIKMPVPHIDHDHATGQIRMLLCRNCNTMLGMANDNATILSNAIKYLEKFQSTKKDH